MLSEQSSPTPSFRLPTAAKPGDSVLNTHRTEKKDEFRPNFTGGRQEQRWIEESQGDASEFRCLREEGQTHQIEQVGERLRSRMAWLQQGGGET